MQSWHWTIRKLSLSRPLLVSCALLIGVAGLHRPQSCFATTEQEASKASDAKFVVTIDLAALRSTDFGKTMIDLGRTQLSRMIKGEAGKNADISKINEAIGFDPFEEIQSIVVSSTSFENPEKTLVATIQLKKSTGNLEGLVLGVPNYSESKYQGHTIHSAKPDNQTEVHAAIATDEAGNKRVVVSSSRSMLEQSLSNRSDATVRNSKADGNPQLISVRVIGLPEELLRSVSEGPHAAITKMLRNMKLDLLDAQQDLKLVLELSTEKEEQSEQVRQMLQGLIALLQFAQTTDIKDKDLQQLKKYTGGLRADRQGNTVKLEVQVPTKEVMEAIDRELSKRK